MKILLTIFSCIALMACSGDNGGNGNGSPSGLNHNQLAQAFVRNLNLDAEFNVQLIKQTTDQNNFIVIYDPLADSYDAINIDLYDPVANDAAGYYFQHSARGFFDLDQIPGHYEAYATSGIVGYDRNGFPITGIVYAERWVPTKYRDRNSGLLFEKIKGSTKDLAKITALVEAASVKKTADFLSSEFGLSMERAKEIAGLKAHWKKAGVKGMTASEIDSFSTELLGFSLTKGIEAYKSSVEGNSSSLDSLVNEAAAVNGITPEHAEKLMSEFANL